MTKEEAMSIKDEILKKEGSIRIGNSLIIDGAVLIKDMLDIINNHLAKSEDKKCSK